MAGKGCARADFLLPDSLRRRRQNRLFSFRLDRPPTLSRHDWIALGVLAVLTVARTLAYLVFAPVHFDSDQAVFGIMAIDLAHLQALPIVMYGQTYLLAVISWLAAPLFAVFGPSIALLKAPFVPINVVTVGALYVVLRKAARLDTAASAIVAATLALPTVVLSQSFMNASGGHLEPVLYVALVFALRRRPIALGLAGAFMVAHREVTAVALIALAVIQLWRAEDRRVVGRHWLETAVVFAVALAAIRWSTHWSTNYGGVEAGYAVTRDLANGLSWLARDTSLLLGLGPHDLRDAGFVLPFVEGSRVSLAVMGVLGILAIAAVVRMRGRWRQDARLEVGEYLVLTCALVALAFSGREMAHDTLLIRYLFILGLLPAALGASILAGDPSRAIRLTTLAALAWLAAANGLANAKYYRALSDARLPDPLGAVATFLDEQGVTTGIAPYWVSYNLTFRTGAKVHVASSELVRIPAYQEEYHAHRDRAVRIDMGPCDPGREILVRGVKICMPK